MPEVGRSMPAVPWLSVCDEPKSKRESIFDFGGASDSMHVQKYFDDAVGILVDFLPRT